MLIVVLWIFFPPTFRHILAAVPFNFNLRKEDKCKESDGKERMRVSYPKFKNGEATVRSVKINPNFGKWFPSMCCKLCACVCIESLSCFFIYVYDI